MISEQDVRSAIEQAVWSFRQKVPIDTGNMRNNATKIVPVSENQYKLYIDKNIAPYFPYVNGPWISPRWHGARNDNAGFFIKAAIEYANTLTSILGGEMEVIYND